MDRQTVARRTLFGLLASLRFPLVIDRLCKTVGYCRLDSVNCCPWYRLDQPYTVRTDLYRDTVPYSLATSGRTAMVDHGRYTGRTASNHRQL